MMTASDPSRNAPDPTPEVARVPSRGGVAGTAPFTSRKAVPNPEFSRILCDCRDLMSHRMMVSMTSMMDRLADGLADRANRSDDATESMLLVDARAVLQSNRAFIVDAFDRALRGRIDRRLEGEAQAVPRADPDDGGRERDDDAREPTDGTRDDEQTAINDFARSLAHRCREQLVALNARIGFLVGERSLTTERNPFGPHAFGAAFREAWESVDIRPEAKVTIIRMMEAGVIGDMNGIYADLNRYLVNLNVLPQLQRGVSTGAAGGDPTTASAPDSLPSREGGAADCNAASAELMSMLPPPNDPHAMIVALTRLQQSYRRSDESRSIEPAAGHPPTRAAHRDFLRRLTPEDLGTAIDPAVAATIELVAMVFEFVGAEDRLSDALRHQLYRMQIPLLKVALLDRNFFTDRSHPARVLVNRYADAGLRWQPDDGEDDPLYARIREGVDRIEAGFTDDIGLFAHVLADFDAFVANEEAGTRRPPQAAVDAIVMRERRDVSGTVVDAELDRRINSAQPPAFLVAFLRNQWRQVLVNAYLESGEEGDDWRTVLAETDNLLWSVQPKWKVRDRKDLVTRLPDMLSRLRARLSDIEWDINAREGFMGELVESHARAVTATMDRDAAGKPPTMPLSGALSRDESTSKAQRASSDATDRYDGLVDSLSRGMWVEFTEESGILVFAKLTWVSPLRGKYLFTHRNGSKAFSLTRDELAARFRNDTAQPVETEPLLDRAFSDVRSRLSGSAKG